MVKGNVVQLKSGGPNMTVTSVRDVSGIQEDKTVTCSFFDGQGEADTITVPIVCLMLSKVATRTPKLRKGKTTLA